MAHLVTNNIIACQARTKANRQCSINSNSTLFDERLKIEASHLLRCGAPHCTLHMTWFSVIPHTISLDSTERFMYFFFDLETTGLILGIDTIVEIGAIECSTSAKFSTVVNPHRDTVGSEVHGIQVSELAHGPSFKDAFSRFVGFVDGVVNDAVYTTDSDSTEGCLEPSQPVTVSDNCRIVLVAHNGIRFDFPMLLADCIRHNTDTMMFHRWLFVDTVEIFRALDNDHTGECMKLQCCRKATSNDCSASAHRALDDAIILHRVVESWAARLGKTCCQLLSLFTYCCDANSSEGAIALLMEGQTTNPAAV